MKPRLLLFTAACMLFAACGNFRGDLSTGIIPAPQQVAWGDGAFRMPSTLLFATNLEGQAKADLEAWMRRSGDGFFPVSFAEAAGDDIPVLYLLLAEGGAPESYRLDVARGKITVTAPDAAGLFYGLQSLGQLAERCGRRIPAVVIEDAPRFGYRGFMLDVSRHFRDKEFVKRQLDLLARYKFNRFHWHLTDGAGWRIEIKKYPVLTDIGRMAALSRLGGVELRRQTLLPPRRSGGRWRLLYAGRNPRGGRIRPRPAYRGDPRNRDAGPQRGGAGRLPRTFVQRETLCQLRLLHRQRTDVRIPRKRPFRGDRTLPLGVYPHRAATKPRSRAGAPAPNAPRGCAKRG